MMRKKEDEGTNGIVCLVSVILVHVKFNYSVKDQKPKISFQLNRFSVNLVFIPSLIYLIINV